MRKTEEEVQIKEGSLYPSSKGFMNVIGLNNVQSFGKIKIQIPFLMQRYIRLLHNIYPQTEWLGIVKMEKVSDGVFVLLDIIHPPQRITGADVSATDKGMVWAHEWIMENDPENIDKWNCVIHSHHRMGVFRSATDDNARKNLNDGRTAAFAIVTAYKGDDITYKGCLNFYRPFPLEIDAEIEVETEPEIEWLSFEDKAKVIKENMDYSLTSAFLGEAKAKEIEQYYEREIHPKFVEFLSDKPTLTKALMSEKYDEILPEEWKDSIKELRNIFSEKTLQLKQHIVKTYTSPWGKTSHHSSVPTWKQREGDEKLKPNEFENMFFAKEYALTPEKKCRHY